MDHRQVEVVVGVDRLQVEEEGEVDQRQVEVVVREGEEVAGHLREVREVRELLMGVLGLLMEVLGQILAVERYKHKE